MLSQVAEVRDKSGADSQAHINWLVTKNLMTALTPGHKVSEERALGLEVLTSLSILQPKVIPALIPELPPLILRELRQALDHTDGIKDSTSIPADLLFLVSALHTSPHWLLQYWAGTAEMMAECISSGHALSVLKGLDVVLDAIPE
jgi:hypothetical protein